VDKDEVERKIKNFLSHFARESKTVREEKIANTKSGSGASTYEGKCFAFKSIEFLLYRNKPRTTVNTEVCIIFI